MAGWLVSCELWVSLGLVVSQVIYENGLVRVIFVSTRVRTGHVRVEFFQLIRVAGRVSIGVFFITLNPNSTLTQPINTIYHTPN